MSTNLYTLYAVSTGSTGDIQGIIDQNLDTQTSELVQYCDGQDKSRFTGIHSVQANLGFTSVAIEDAMDALGTYGLATASGETATFSFQKLVSGGGRTGTGCKTLSAPGYFFPTTLECSTGDVAKLSAIFIPVSTDGETSSLTVGSSLPEITLVQPKLFTAGIFKIGSTKIGCVDSISIDFGISHQTRLCNGLPFAQDVFVDSYNPIVTIRTTDFSTLATGDMDGKTDSITVFLRKKDPGGANVAAATAEHIKFHATSALIFVRSITASQDGAAMIEYVCRPIYDGTNAPIAYTKSVAIS